ncbi:flagellar biosynthesis protein FlhB [Aquibacillus sp. 3ASR75-11]|uniref:Flagellar biosynthetic protein FlhB n=1 Tax=Terrihalobacillus insolitus TaxID=2950438 RepID=A0A9X4AKQ4_9BACI|nr:flagellar biosynthesis protein FlhB [Terrihalobacillus insolitus]MDC3414121.1 flagellar biosynthesis protein FlhB [Terrihalobacillus insolitus]MDC3423562.1 flagellar biosynthesis protein FlhB [Terrihalobacillus insolitus]
MELTLDLQFFAGEKTEKATPKKRQDSRKKGQVAKSQDVNTAIMLLLIFFLFLFVGDYMKNVMTSMFTLSFTEYIQWEVTEQSVSQIFFESTLEMSKAVAPIMGVAIVAGLLSNLTQIGFLYTTETLKFDLKKIDPIQGAKKIFSARALVELVKSLLKIVFIGTVTFSVLWFNKDEMMMTSGKDVESSLAFFGNTTVVMGIMASIVLLLLSAIDFVYQKYDYEKNIRMSKNDIKDENKNIEGDPLIKSKIKEKQRQMAMRRMMSEVPKADVIITNPTHYAIAIKYDEQKADAPYVVAKGVDHIAFKIKEIAKAHQVSMVENRPLARSMYDQVEIGDVIGEEFFQAVAEILAYVYQLKKKV